MRFIFGLSGSSLRMHLLPYLKRLHFLPVKFRIEFKIALLIHKCLHGYAPTYLKNLSILVLLRQDTACELMMVIGCFKR